MKFSAEMNKYVRQNPVFIMFFVFLLLTCPLPFFHMNYILSPTIGTVASIDQRTYENKNKHGVYYTYFADIYFDEFKTTKTMQVSEKLHSEASVGDKYYYSKSDAQNLTFIGFCVNLLSILHIIFFVGSIVVLGFNAAYRLNKCLVQKYKKDGD